MSKANINLKTKNISFEKMWSLNVENTVMGKKKNMKRGKIYNRITGECVYNGKNMCHACSKVYLSGW